MTCWEDAADWYLGMVNDPARGFNDLADATTLALMGPVLGKDVLDVGSGEGHFARRLAQLGARVQAVEPVAAFHEAALVQAPPGVVHHLAPAEDLGLIGSGSVDIVCAVLVLHHVASLPTALSEAHRVLRPGGALVAVVPHPMTDHPGAAWSPAGRVLGDYGAEGYWSSGSSSVESVRDIGWYHRRLSTWLRLLAEGGFAVTEAQEPTPATGRWAGVPRFWAFRAVAWPQKSR